MQKMSQLNYTGSLTSLLKIIDNTTNSSRNKIIKIWTDRSCLAFENSIADNAQIFLKNDNVDKTANAIHNISQCIDHG